MADDDGHYINVRDPNVLGTFVGCTLVDITQHDADEFAERGSFICLHFSNGRTVTFPIGEDGFNVELPA